MALKAYHNEVEFSVGDKVSVTQTVKEGAKERLQVFEGIVISIKGRAENRSFTVRKIGVQQVGIERIFPLAAPCLRKIEVTRKGGLGVRRAKLYFIRQKSKREIEKLYSRSSRRERTTEEKVVKKPRLTKRVASRKVHKVSPKRSKAKR
jgi:large subunit ribosomal protein L19